MLVAAAVLLLPLILCAPAPPSDPTTEALVGWTDTFHCLRGCFGMNTVNVEVAAGEKRCMRLVDYRTLWDEKNTMTIEGPRCGVYSTMVVSSPKLSVELVLAQIQIRINHTMPSDGAYSQCVRKCMDIDTVAPEECTEGQREYGLISSGKEEGYDWSAFYGYGCKEIHTIITTYEDDIPILIDDGEVGLFLFIRDGEMNAVQGPMQDEEEKEQATTTESSYEDEEDEEGITESTDDYNEQEEEETSTDSSYEDEEEGESATESTDDYDEEYDDEDEDSTEDLKKVQKIAEWLPCPLACINRKDEHVFTPLAMKFRASDNDGNWWYNRYTFQEQSNSIVTLIDHDADTRIRFDLEADGNVFNHTVMNKKFATCLSACMGDEETKHIKACSESTLIPTWTIVDGSGDRERYGRLTLAIPLPHGGCHSLVTFALSTYDSNKLRIIYARDEEEIFSIENERAISRIVHTTNSSLLNVDSD